MLLRAYIVGDKHVSAHRKPRGKSDDKRHDFAVCADRRERVGRAELARNGGVCGIEKLLHYAACRYRERKQQYCGSYPAVQHINSALVC